MTTATDIKSAIARSISHNEIVKVEVAEIAAALAEVNSRSDEYEHTDANEGEDVWGATAAGEEFRLLLVTACDLPDFGETFAVTAK